MFILGLYENDVIPTSISDHDMVGFCSQKIVRMKVPPKIVRSRNYTKYVCENMKAELKNHDWSPLYEINNVNHAWLYMKEVLLSTFNKHAPITARKVKGRFCPWPQYRDS